MQIYLEKFFIQDSYQVKEHHFEDFRESIERIFDYKKIQGIPYNWIYIEFKNSSIHILNSNLTAWTFSFKKDK